MKWAVRLCVAGLLVSSSLLYLLKRSRDNEAAQIEMSNSVPNATIANIELEPRDQFDTESRSVAQEGQYQIRIVTDEGAPIAGVSARIYECEPVGVAPESSVGPNESAHQSSLAWEGKSDEHGGLQVNRSVLDTPHPKFVLLSKPGYELHSMPIGRFSDGSTHEIRLRSRPLVIRVIDGLDATQSSGIVVISGSVSLDGNSSRIATNCSFEYELGPRGLVEVPYAPNWSVQAWREGFASIKTRIDSQKSIALRIRPTFAVTFISDDQLDFAPMTRIEIKGAIGSATVSLGSVHIAKGTHAAKAEIPYVGNCRYFAFSVGDDWSSSCSEIPSPTPGQKYEIQLSAVGDRSWTAQVVDQVGAPIDLAVVKCCWLDSAGVAKWSDRTSDHGGFVRFNSLPDSAVWFVAEKVGYFQRYSVDEWTQYPRKEVTTIKMERGNVIAGRVLRSGRPIEDFCVWFAPEGCGWNSAYFECAAAGEFEISGIPDGNVEIIAVAPSGGQSAVERMSVPGSIGRPVTLELEQRLGRGRCSVIDAASGQPVAGVEVELLVQAGGTVIGAQGLAWKSDHQGEVEFDGVTDGTNRIQVGRVGYERLTVSAFSSGEATLDFGQIRLNKVGSLSVRIVPDGPLRLDWCSIAVFGSRALPRTLFSTEGVALYEGVPAGPTRIEMLRADSVEEIIELELGAPPREQVEIPITVNGRMNVELSAKFAARAVGCEFIYRTTEGWLRRTFAASNGQSRFVVPVDPRMVEEVEVQANGMVRLMRRSVSEAERQAALVSLDEIAGLNVRVNSRQGAPIAGTSVLLRRVDGDERVILDARTDESGAAEFVGMGWEMVDVLVFHPQIGVRPSERVDLKELAGRTLELELNPIGRTRVAVRDGEVAIAGVQVRFLDPKYNAGRAMTDEEGVAWSLPLQEGKYRAEVGQSGYWPAAIDFECNKEEVWTTLQVRRTGGLDLELQSASGRDVRSYVLELRSKEFETSVSGWLDAGKVVSPQGGRPDKDGRLELYGLPNGEYTWTAILDGAGVMAGEIQVEPHSVNKKKLFLP